MAETFEIDMGGDLAEEAEKADKALGGLLGSMGKIIPGASGLISKFTSLGDVLGMSKGEASVFGGEMGLAVGPVLAMGTAAIAAGVAIGALTLKMAAMALEASQAKAQLLATFSALAGGATQGQAVLKMLDELGAKFNLTREQTGPWATSLLAAGLSADKLKDALLAVAGANALIAGGGDKVTNLLAKLNEQGMKGTKIRLNMGMLAGTGITEPELMKALGMTPHMFELAKKQGTITGQQLSDAIVKILGEKGKGPLEQQATSLTSIWAKFKENIGKLFEDVDTKPFLEALKDMLSIFDQSTESGRTLKTMITGALNAIFSAAAKVLPYIKVGLLAIVYYAFKVYVALKPAIAQLKEAFSRLFSGAGGGSRILGIFISALSRGAGMMISFGIWTARVATAIADLVGWFQKGEQSAKNLISGLVGGIDGGSGSVVAAIKRLASSAIGALKGALQISSPSRVMMQLGVHTATGMAQGISAGHSRVSAASAGMAQAAKVAAAPRGAGGGSIRVDVGGIHIEGVGSSGEALSLTEEAVAAVFERMALQQGLGTA